MQLEPLSPLLRRAVAIIDKGWVKSSLVQPNINPHPEGLKTWAPVTGLYLLDGDSYCLVGALMRAIAEHVGHYDPIRYSTYFAAGDRPDMLLSRLRQSVTRFMPKIMLSEVVGFVVDCTGKLGNPGGLINTKHANRLVTLEEYNDYTHVTKAHVLYLLKQAATYEENAELIYQLDNDIINRATMENVRKALAALDRDTLVVDKAEIDKLIESANVEEHDLVNA